VSSALRRAAGRFSDGLVPPFLSHLKTGPHGSELPVSVTKFRHALRLALKQCLLWVNLRFLSTLRIALLAIVVLAFLSFVFQRPRELNSRSRVSFHHGGGLCRRFTLFFMFASQARVRTSINAFELLSRSGHSRSETLLSRLVFNVSRNRAQSTRRQSYLTAVSQVSTLVSFLVTILKQIRA